MRNNLVDYCKYIEIPGAPVNDDEDCEEFYPDKVTPAQHHKLLLDRLQDVADGKIKRLMILMPPGSAKSTYASVVFPTWFMGRYPNKNIIMATYGSDLAKKFGRKCRSIAKSKEFAELFNCGLTGGNAAADDWSITNGSTYMCGGILSGITGNRADGIITDDPIKGREEADSETTREKVKAEYKDSLFTRLKPKGWEIIINTRWHEDDLSGQYLPEGYDGGSGWFTAKDGTKWFVLCLQAQCEHENDPLGRKIGEYLWTDWFTPDWWEDTKRRQSTPTPRTWNALYQQRPASDDGDFFKREWLRWYDARPKHLRIYGASDYAVTDKGGDWTVHGVIGIDPDDNIYVLDWWRGQTDSMVWVESLLDLMRMYKPLEWAEEGGVIANSIAPLIDKRQREERVYCYRNKLGTAGDKSAKAQSIRGRMAAGKVYFPNTAPWIDALITEMMTFPNGKHDDQVDVLGMFGRMLDDMIAAKKPDNKQPEAPRLPTINEIIQRKIRNKESD